MQQKTNSDHILQITLCLEIVPEDPQDADIALVNAVGRNAIDALRKDGYTVQFPDTGQKGANFLVDVMTFLGNIPADVWAQKDALDITSALITILTPLISMVRLVRNAYEKQVGKDAARQYPIKIKAEISDASLIFEIEAPDLEAAEGASKLAKRLIASYPTSVAKITPQSRAKVRASVPKKPPRRRR